MPDSLTDMIDELRVQRPRDAGWLDGLTLLVQALPTRARRRATVLLIANDLVIDYPGLCLGETYWTMARTLLGEAEVEQMQRDRQDEQREQNEWMELHGEA
jgi:hypothetical protein